MEPSRLHELNKLAGEFCGKEMEERNSRWFTIMTFPEGNVLSEWSPCTDHNQAAEVKATLREKFIRYSMRMIFLCSGQIFHEWELEDLDGFAHNGRDESELIALLLAVEALGKEVA